MRGHKALTAARLAGYPLADVFVVVLATEPHKRGFLDAEESLVLGDTPEIDIGPSDMPALLDLRCIRGLRAHVCGEDGQRVRAVATRAKTFEPSEILAVADDALLRWKPKA